jgi:hypothetical protein
LWQYSLYVELCDCYRGRLWEYSESAKLDWKIWRDWIDVAITAEKIGRGLKTFAKSLKECFKTQSYDIPNILRYELQNMCWRISRHLYQTIDYALEEVLEYAEDLNASVEERTQRQAAYDQLQMDVSRFREEIAAAHNPEASSGKSFIIPIFQSPVLRDTTRIDMDTSE